jgi:tetratricopeptide (TPR) repeat protein
MMPVEEIFKQAVAHHDAHRWSDAQSLYRQVLSMHLDHAPALRLLGLLAVQMGNAAEAVKLLRKAVALDPSVCEYWGNLGVALATQGQLDEALKAFQKACDLRPDDAECCTNLAGALQQKGRIDEAIEIYRKARDLQPAGAPYHFNHAQAVALKGELDTAIESFRRAIALRPSYAKAWNNLAGALLQQGKKSEAIEAYSRAIIEQPDYAEAFFNLGTALYKNGDVAEAIEAFQQTLRLKPDFTEALDHLGTALHAGKQSAEAIATYQRAIALRPNFAEACNNLANVLLDEERLEEAEESYRKAIVLRPSYADAWSNLGTAVQRQGRFEEAKETYRHATELDPTHAAAQFNLAWALLQQGDFEHGWALHDARLQIEEELHGRRFSQPLWDGAPLHGKRILLHAEQGIGDTIQFIRYVPWVASLGGVVFVETQPPLHRLLKTVEGVAQIISRGDPLPDFDVHCPLMSLPRRHHTRLQAVPAEVPYLRVSQGLARSDDGTRRQGDREKGRIGLVWSGNPIHTRDKHRSVRLSAFTPLLEVPNVEFYSLQKGPAEEELTAYAIANRKSQIANTPDLSDFADTAALIMNLDLIISVDTAVAHLAGALARPVWVLLPFIPDWRWMLDRSDSPWYPTMRLFRQPKQGDWQTPIHRIASELKSLGIKA